MPRHPLACGQTPHGLHPPTSFSTWPSASLRHSTLTQREASHPDIRLAVPRDSPPSPEMDDWWPQSTTESRSPTKIPWNLHRAPLGRRDSPLKDSRSEAIRRPHSGSKPPNESCLLTSLGPHFVFASSSSEEDLPAEMNTSVENFGMERAMSTSATRQFSLLLAPGSYFWFVIHQAI